MYRFKQPSAPNTNPEQKPEQSKRSTTPRDISWKKALAISALPLAVLFVAAFQSPNTTTAQLWTIQNLVTALKSEVSEVKSEVTSLANNGLKSDISDLKSQISALQVQLTSLANTGPRKFYLTKTTTHNGAQALLACAQGYHMASLWEIHAPSSLRYDRDLGFTLDDSGFGPPTTFGWIRTGNSAGRSGIAGFPNCGVWTSANAGDTGTIVSLSGGWNLPGVTANPWNASVSLCSAPAPVWCVQD